MRAFLKRSFVKGRHCVTGGDPVCIYMLFYRDAGIEDYLRTSELIGLDWMAMVSLNTRLIYTPL